MHYLGSLFPQYSCQVISNVQPQWLDQVVDSYTADDYSQGIIAKLVADSTFVPHFAWSNGFLHYKGRIWVGMDTQLHLKLISAFHCSALEGPFWIFSYLKEDEANTCMKRHENCCQGICSNLLSLSAGQT
jgi:hypothetical protein